MRGVEVRVVDLVRFMPLQGSTASSVATCLCYASGSVSSAQCFFNMLLSIIGGTTYHRRKYQLKACDMSYCCGHTAGGAGGSVECELCVRTSACSHPIVSRVGDARWCSLWYEVSLKA